ncbi:hypothetical protein A2Z00_01390 [Candidatus Gottesmanbacteria bacterium RBG_13_45_10]|uniref:Uncharacterized protein n=1 Tax=Candidatus Gottesmanbacteria bacterium RBG_13_45_10 TaxID=1798370 RepID=A0A1F5ZGU2_9BACT|nr:MAG: hypothetical protein A2Z00_01390 [Candidatus Gottesmanbacteria bacterium RBG_13_45_10]
MSKTKKVKPADLEKAIMDKVKSNRISIKPRWYFVLGSAITMIGVIGLSVGAIFLTNLTFFLLRTHGPMGQLRLEMMLASFPWWAPILAIVGIVLGIWMLKQYDFSYKKNFVLIVLGFIVSIVLAAFIIDRLGVNEMWSKRGPMRRLYQQMEYGRGNRMYRYK